MTVNKALKHTSLAPFLLPRGMA